jgi:hypothetical protein
MSNGDVPSFAELREMFSEIARVQAENARYQAETTRQMRERDERMEAESRKRDRQIAKTDRQIAKTDKQVAELRQHIGGLANKFGTYTEAFALPSMQQQLKDRFHIEAFAARVGRDRGGRSYEIDALGYSNTDRNEAFIVEIKSLLKFEGIDQVLRQLDQFFDFFPEHRGKELYGVLAVVDAVKGACEKAREEGLYVARISDGIFRFQVPDDFKPRSFASRDPRS